MEIGGWLFYGKRKKRKELCYCWITCSSCIFIRSICGYFNDPVATATSTLIATELKKTSGTLIEFAVNLEEGKTFEFEAPVQNDGTVNAKLDTLTLSGASDKVKLVTFEVASDSELKEKDVKD